MPTDRNDAPPPDLRIVLTDSLQPHEEHDSQRANPLIERLKHEQVFINPPIVAQISADPVSYTHLTLPTIYSV